MTVVNWITAIGIPSIVIGLIFIGGKLQILSRLDSTMDKVKCNLKLIADALISARFAGFDHEKLQAYSPLKITESGDRFLTEIGFKKIFGEHAQDFYQCIDEEKPATNYDVEGASVKCVFFLFDKPYFNGIKEYLYQHPNEQKDGVIKLAGIYVRDRYMEYRHEKNTSHT